MKTIIVPEKVRDCIEKIGNKSKKLAGYKVYAALLSKEKYKNKKSGFFSVPSKYLQLINSRYKSILTAFEQSKIISVYSRIDYNPDDIFDYIKIEVYDSERGKCKRYKFNIDITQGRIMEIEMSNKRKYRWFDIIKNSMSELGYEGKITRDGFGRRVHHPVIRNYKSELAGRGLVVIDAKASHPRLLLSIMQSKGIIDINFEKAFQQGFYEFLREKMELQTANDAKKLSMYWINSKNYLPDHRINKLFPIATAFIKELKGKNYKDAASFMQRAESAIWIDDLLEHLPSEFGIPIHDSLIVRKVEADKILAYCQCRYPNIEFTYKDL